MNEEVVKTNLTKTNEIVQDVVMEEVTPSHQPSKCVKNDTFIAKSKKPCLAEPKFRFHNRMRRGSFLTISKSDYLLMAQGKPITFHNANSNSFMVVRTIIKVNEQ